MATIDARVLRFESEEWAALLERLRPWWHRGAACHETPEVNFFPGKGQPVRAARAVCARCSVSRECLAYALENDCDDGVWGGTTPNERRQMRRSGGALAG